MLSAKICSSIRSQYAPAASEAGLIPSLYTSSKDASKGIRTNTNGFGVVSATAQDNGSHRNCTRFAPWFCGTQRGRATAIGVLSVQGWGLWDSAHISLEIAI